MTEGAIVREASPDSPAASNAEAASLLNLALTLPVLPGGFIQGGEAHAEIEAG